MPVDPLWDQMKWSSDGGLPVDRLRKGEMTDGEVLLVAAESLRYHAGPSDPARETFEALANRLKLVRLLDPRQTRARSTYYPRPKPDGGRIHG